jgi:hypothetical protein
MRAFRDKSGAMPRRQKLLAALIVAVYGLIFYAFGIATNLFASPAFSMFWIISVQTAHYIAYGVAAAATTLSIIMLTLNFLKREKRFPEASDKPVVGTSSELSVNHNSLVDKQESTNEATDKENRTR